MHAKAYEEAGRLDQAVHRCSPKQKIGPADQVRISAFTCLCRALSLQAYPATEQRLIHPLRLLAKLQAMQQNLADASEDISKLQADGVLNGFKRKTLSIKF